MSQGTMNRRQMLHTSALVGAGTVAGTLLAGCVQAGPAVKPDLDLAILNFALNLEYLEAQFYSWAAFGHGLDAGLLTGTGNQGALTGGAKVPFASMDVQQYAEEIAMDELNHVKFLRSALGSNAVAMPSIDIGPAFAAAGNAASKGAIQGFNPYANDLFFLHGAFIFEDVGVTAYAGAAPLVTNPDYLSAAAKIMAVEAYHASEVRTLLYAQRNVTVTGMLKVSDVVQAISDLRGSVGGGKDQGILAGGRANIVPTDANGLAFARSTTEVLAIVTLGGAGNKGGFFPGGLNGDIK